MLRIVIEVRKKTLLILLAVIIVLGLIGGGIFYWNKKYNLDPGEEQTYYTIFNRNVVLNGHEDSTTEVDKKLDKRLALYHYTFSKMAGTNDETTLRALFYMNFVRMFGVYGNRDLHENTIKDILWGDPNYYFQCGTYTTLLAMLLDKAGYQLRTVEVNGGAHGYVEVMLNGRWQILDPTINTWVDQSTENLLNGVPRNTKTFFYRAQDPFKSPNNLYKLLPIQEFMTHLGQGYSVKIDQYNYIDLSSYAYQRPMPL